MAKKLTIEFIRSEFEKENYILLTTEYRNNEQKLKYRCSNNHRHSVSWGNWIQGKRCPYCANRPPIDIAFIRSELAKDGYQLLSKKYINNRQKLHYICSEGHKHSITWAMWRRGQRCPYCAGLVKKDIKFVKFEFAKEGYELLSKEYINARQKLNYICPEDHRHNINWLNWSSGKRCPYCSKYRNRYTVDFIRSEFEGEGYVLLANKYKNKYIKLEYICPKSHKHSISWGNWQQGKRCPECTNGISKGEIKVRNFIESLGIKVSPNDRNQIYNPDTGNGFELDIFMPTLNRAIEYNGEYWHKSKDMQNRDLLKQKLCRLKGINLLTIWDKEWKANSKKCKNKIMNFVFSV